MAESVGETGCREAAEARSEARSMARPQPERSTADTVDLEAEIATYDEVTHPKFSADELLVLQRAMAGVFLDEDAPLRDGILRRLAKAEMVARRGYA